MMGLYLVSDLLWNALNNIDELTVLLILECRLFWILQLMFNSESEGIVIDYFGAISELFSQPRSKNSCFISKLESFENTKIEMPMLSQQSVIFS